MGMHGCWYTHWHSCHTYPAFLINALILMALMCSGVESVSHGGGGRNVRESTEHYQSNYVDGTPLSAGYTLSQNYYHQVQPSPADDDVFGGSATDIDDTTSKHHSTSSAGISSGVANFVDLQRFHNVQDGGFLPTTVTAAGRHYIDGGKATFEEHTRYNIDDETMGTMASRQIEAVNAAGKYTTPVGKIDYEMNAPNYDMAANTYASNDGGIGGGDEFGSNDAHNIAAMHDLAQLQYKQYHQYDYQQQQQQQHQNQHQQQHHQLAYGAESVPKVRNAVDVNTDIDPDSDTVGSNANAGGGDSGSGIDGGDAATDEGVGNDVGDGIAAFKNYAAHATTPAETKHQQIDVVDKQNLHDIQALQYANYHQKAESAANLYNDAGRVNMRQPFYTYMAYPQHNKPRQQQHQRYHHRFHNLGLFNNENMKTQNQNYFALVQSMNPFRTTQKQQQQQNSRSLSLNEFDPRLQLPPITQTVRHTPASSAAVAGIPLSRHVEVVRQIPVRIRQRELVPFNRTVRIEVPDPVITTVSKPLPINVTVPNIVAVPTQNIIRIPIERIRPVPVERAVPFLVDRRVPYEVEKQVPKPVFFPYPIRVPVLTTIVHKLSRRAPVTNIVPNTNKKPRRIFYREVVTKSNPFG